MGKYFIGTLFGLVVGFALALLINYVRLEDALAAVAAHISYIVAFGVAVIAALLALYIFRDVISRAVFGVATRELDSLVTEVSEAIDEIADGEHKKAKDRAAEVGRSMVASVVIWASRAALVRVLVTLVIASAGAFGTYVLVQQNGLISEQTEMLGRQIAVAETQTDLINSQTQLLRDQTSAALISAHLQNAARRSVFSTEVNAVISEIRDAAVSSGLQSQREELPDPVNGRITLPSFEYLELSEDLYDRIESLLRSLTPYVLVEYPDTGSDSDFLNVEAVSFAFLSPERGQILQAMLNYGVRFEQAESGIGYDRSFQRTARLFDFSFADMRGFQYNAIHQGSTLYCHPSLVPSIIEPNAITLGVQSLPATESSSGSEVNESFEAEDATDDTSRTESEVLVPVLAPPIVATGRSLHIISNVVLNDADFSNANIHGVQLLMGNFNTAVSATETAIFSSSFISTWEPIQDGQNVFQFTNVCLDAFRPGGLRGAVFLDMESQSLRALPGFGPPPTGPVIGTLDQERSRAAYRYLDGLLLELPTLARNARDTEAEVRSYIEQTIQVGFDPNASLELPDLVFEQVVVEDTLLFQINGEASEAALLERLGVADGPETP